MMQFFSNIDKIDINLWNDYISNHPKSNIYQSFEMYNFWGEQKNHERFIFLIKSSNNDCLGFCTGVIIYNGKFLLKTLSKRAIIFGEPLIAEIENKEEILDFFLKETKNFLRKKSVYIESRNFTNNNTCKHIYNKNNWKYVPYQNYIIPLDNDKNVLNRIKPEKRRQIRKAVREGVKISYIKSEENIISLYEILKYTYIKRVKKPLPSLSFFKNLMLLDSSGITCVSFNDKIIGGGFFVYDKNKVYDWYRVGLDYEYKKQYPSTVATWALLKYGLDNGMDFFDFMGAGIKGQEYGVRKFKSQFGGELVEYGRFLKVNKSLIYNIGKVAFKILKILT